MTTLLAEPKPHPADPNRPLPWPYPPTGPQVAMGHPDGDGMGDPSQPPTTPRTTLRTGHAPRLPRRRRLARVLNQSVRYLGAYALIGWACMWLGDVHMVLPGMVLAAMVANPRRPKQASPSVPSGTVLAVHSPPRPRLTRAGLSSAVLPRASR